MSGNFHISLSFRKTAIIILCTNTVIYYELCYSKIKSEVTLMTFLKRSGLKIFLQGSFEMYSFILHTNFGIFKEYYSHKSWAKTFFYIFPWVRFCVVIVSRANVKSFSSPTVSTAYNTYNTWPFLCMSRQEPT